MTANSLVPVSLDPPLVLVSLDNRSHMHRILPSVGRYGISVLAEDQKALSNHFAGRPIGEANIRFIDRAGTTLLDGALAHFVVKMFRIHPAGDHTLYVGSVEYFELQLQRDHTQMKDRSTAFHAGFMYQHAGYLLIQRHKQWTYTRQQSRSREIAWTFPAPLLDSAPSESLDSEILNVR